MKVFIGWSGERSKALAQALRDWIPLVLHYVEPWLCEADVDAGERWGRVVANELEASNFGIICVTSENVASQWLLFEAGALAKSMQGSRVIPLLLDLEFSDISGPLAQFQAKKVGESGLREVIRSINEAADPPLEDTHVDQLFQALWPQLEAELRQIPDEAPAERHTRPTHEILEELVAGVRALDSRLQDLASELPEGFPPSRRFRRFAHPIMMEEIVHALRIEPGDPSGLLIWAGMLRDAVPWLYELVMEGYRAKRAGAHQEAERVLHQLHRVVRLMERGPFPMEELGLHPEEVYGLARGVERFLMEPPRADEDESDT